MVTVSATKDALPTDCLHTLVEFLKISDFSLNNIMLLVYVMWIICVQAFSKIENEMLCNICWNLMLYFFNSNDVGSHKSFNEIRYTFSHYFLLQIKHVLYIIVPSGKALKNKFTIRRR